MGGKDKAIIDVAASQNLKVLLRASFTQHPSLPNSLSIQVIDPVSMGKYGYERISSGLAPVVTRFHGLIPR